MMSRDDYTEEERQFLVAVDRFKRSGHPFPTWRQVLSLVKRLGYRRPEFPDKIKPAERE